MPPLPESCNMALCCRAAHTGEGVTNARPLAVHAFAAPYQQPSLEGVHADIVLGVPRAIPEGKVGSRFGLPNAHLSRHAVVLLRYAASSCLLSGRMCRPSPGRTLPGLWTGRHLSGSGGRAPRRCCCALQTAACWRGC